MEDVSKVVFIGNLSWVVNSEQLYNFLAAGGLRIVSAEVQRYSDTNRSKGWGLAEFENHGDACKAVDTLNGKMVNGRQVHLRLDRSVVHSNGDLSSVYVGNLAWNVTEQLLFSLFERFHPIACHVLTNMYGRSRGFALIKFCDEVSAGMAIQELNDVEFHGRRIECRSDRGPGKSIDSDDKHTIFVSKLGPAIVEDKDLAAIFNHVGPIQFVRLQRAAKGRTKGWGVVKFLFADDAKRAIETMSGFKMADSSIPLEIRFDRKL